MVNSYTNCFEGNQWNYQRACNSVKNCTENCVLEGADYAAYGVKTNGDTISLKFKTYHDFAHNLNSRVYLMETPTKYQMFTLMGNELAFDVDLSTVECGINSALYFVAMEPDGGMSRYPSNKYGARYGTGYCDASCDRGLKFVAGKVCSSPDRAGAFLIDHRFPRRTSTTGCHQRPIQLVAEEYSALVAPSSTSGEKSFPFKDNQSNTTSNRPFTWLSMAPY
jgi:hypothetical protein